MLFNWFKKKNKITNHQVIFEVAEDGSIHHHIYIIPPKSNEPSEFIEDLGRLFFYIQSNLMTHELCNAIEQFGETNNCQREVLQILSFWQQLNQAQDNTFKKTDNSIRPTEVFGQYFNRKNEN